MNALNNIELDETENQNEQKIVPVSAQLVILSLVLLAIFGSGYMPKIISLFDQPSTEQQPAAGRIDQTQASSQSSSSEDAFKNVALVAEAAFVWDVTEQRVLYKKNPDKQLPLASIVKLMTALVAYEIVSDQTTVPISLSAISQDGESGLKDGETFTLETLTDFTLMSSSNDGAYAIAAAAGNLLNEDTPAQAFVESMNIRAKELGLTQTYFRNPTGLDISETEAGAYGSVRDIAFLVEYILKTKPQILERTTEATAILYNNNGEYHEATNTNRAIDDIQGIIGSKTGYTALAGGNLTIAFDASLNRPIVIAVLGSTFNDRFSDVLSLSEAARQAI